MHRQDNPMPSFTQGWRDGPLVDFIHIIIHSKHNSSMPLQTLLTSKQVPFTISRFKFVGDPNSSEQRDEDASCQLPHFWMILNSLSSFEIPFHFHSEGSFRFLWSLFDYSRVKSKIWDFRKRSLATALRFFNVNINAVEAEKQLKIRCFH